MDLKPKEFLNAKIPAITRLSKAENLAYWNATTTGDEEYEQEYAALHKELLTLLSNPRDFEQLKKFTDSSEIDDPLLRRQLDILYNQFLENQVNPELISELVQKETEIESKFTSFRAYYRGKRISDNDIQTILQSDTDSSNRQEAWEASKQIGKEVAAKVIDLVALRNRIAQSLGFKNYHVMALSLNEIDPTYLFNLLEELERATVEPYRQMKNKLDKELARRFGTDVIMPWHYSDPFFQEAPVPEDLDFGQVFANINPVEVAVKYYSSIGLDVEDILARSDLYEREGKNQHAYCIDIDRLGDVRILCNLRNDANWMSTLLHELGHGVYDKYHDSELPYLLRTHAHVFTTEAVAMLMGRLTTDPYWLVTFGGAPDHIISGQREKLKYYSALSQLVFIRWAMVVVYFERELYANPRQDLDQLWWNLVEKIQLVKRPPGRQAPDWAAKIHIAAAPAYYQNYILGELTASQLNAALEKSYNYPAADNRIGQFLVDNIFRPGARYHWNDLITRATGESLSAKYFAKQFIDSFGALT